MATLASMSVRLGIDTDQLRAGAQRATGLLKGVAKSVSALGVAAPAAGAAAVAVGGIAAAYAAAGIAAKAFTLAAGPQMEQVTSAAELYTAAQAASAAGGEEAAAAQKQYTDALAAMPAATAATAEAFVGLKSDQQAWSDSLSGTTMPVFTQGIELLRTLLPMLTPLVQAAAKAFSGFLADVSRGVKSAGFKAWADDMSGAAGPALTNFLTVVKNLATGFGGLLQAFAPASAGTTSGLVSMTEAFADWGTSLKGSAGFQQFLDAAAAGRETLGNLGGAVVNLAVALAPLLGTTTLLVSLFAELVSAIPTPVLTVLATTVAAISIGMRLYATYQAIATAATWLFSTAAWSMAAALLANPITWIVLGVVALIAAIVLIATKTTWFQTAWQWMVDAVGIAWDWIWKKLQEGFELLKWLFFNFTGPGLFIKHWDSIKSATLAAWDWVVAKVEGGVRWVLDAIGWLGRIPGRVGKFFTDMNLAVARKLLEFIDWIKGIPGRITGALGNLGKLLSGVGRSIIQGLIDGVSGMIGYLRDKFSSITSMIPDWKGPMSLDMRLLTPSGEAVMGGFMDGITGSVPALRRTLQGVTTGIPHDVNVGLTRASVSGGGAGQQVLVDFAGLSDSMLGQVIQEIVRVDGRGSPTTAFGR